MVIAFWCGRVGAPHEAVLLRTQQRMADGISCCWRVERAEWPELGVAGLSYGQPEILPKFEIPPLAAGVPKGISDGQPPSRRLECGWGVSRAAEQGVGCCRTSSRVADTGEWRSRSWLDRKK